MTATRAARAPVPLLLLALASGCAGRSASPAPAAPTAAAAAGPAPSTAPVQHDLQVTVVPPRRAVLVEDEVTLSPEVRARLGDRIVFTLHAGLSPERAGGPPLEPTPRGPALREDPDAAGA